ncbi:hypothetical protein BGZ96_001344 [Linnemannia gamsii]|uniref:SWIM-type domain-containing protein n=1 Tax=Linnemannia gamsii TaxID=64522 RepID=A0ABQ7K964_9FUNG|nr:hypothetical protein BGZ96_001344 [Linnemannia gamsii]
MEQNYSEEQDDFTESETDHDTDFGGGGENIEVNSDEELQNTQENTEDMVDIAREMRRVDVNSDASEKEGIEDILTQASRDYNTEVDEDEDDDGLRTCSCEDPKDSFVDHKHCKHFRNSDE